METEMECETSNAQCKAVASFQKDPKVRKRVLELIKKKAPKDVVREHGPETERLLHATISNESTYISSKMRSRCSKREESVPGDKATQCSLCGLMYGSSKLLQIHYRRVHLKEKKHKCRYCDFHGFNKGDVQLHELRVHSGVRPVQCSFCSYTTTDAYSLDSHLITHRKIKSFACKLCPYTCGWKHQLNRHAQAHVSAERQVCRVCHVVSRNRKQDLVHFSLHHAHLKEKTNNSDSFQTRKSLQSHLRSLLVNKNNGLHQLKPLSNNDAGDKKEERPSEESGNPKVSNPVVNLSKSDSVAYVLQSNNDSSMSSEQISNHIQMLHASELIRNHYVTMSRELPCDTSKRKTEESVDAMVSGETARIDLTPSEVESAMSKSGHNGADEQSTFIGGAECHSPNSPRENSPCLTNSMPHQLLENIKNSLSSINVKIQLSGEEEGFGEAAAGRDVAEPSPPDLDEALDCLDRELQHYIAHAEQALAAQRQQSLVVSASDVKEIVSIIESKVLAESPAPKDTQATTQLCSHTDSQANIHVVFSESTPPPSSAIQSNTQQITSVELSVLDQILKQLLDGSKDGTGRIAVCDTAISQTI